MEAASGVESSEGKGATFFFTAPRRGRGHTMNAPKADVLLVEDSAAEARLAREALREARFPVELHVASDGVPGDGFPAPPGSATRTAPRPQTRPPGPQSAPQDGREVLRDIKEDADLRRIPVVVLTTSQAQSDITRAYELHANCYIQKPLELDGFIEIVKIHPTLLAPNGGAARLTPLPAVPPAVSTRPSWLSPRQSAVRVAPPCPPRRG